MTNWEILGIEPTKDKSHIKRAYARKLRTVHPEDDPAGYQQLREAFDTLMKQADRPDVSFDAMDRPQEFHMHPETEVTIATDAVFQAESTYEYTQEYEQDPMELFERHLHELYDDIHRRVDPEEWRNHLANQDYMWDVGGQYERFDLLMSFLDEHRHLPHPVWIVLDDLFSMTESFEDDDYYDEELAEFVKSGINGSLAMGYDCFSNKELTFDIEEYLDLRQSAQTSLMEGDFVQAGKALSEARALFRQDPDLELMRAKHALLAGDSEAALNMLTYLIEMNPNLPEAYLMRGKLLLDRQEYIEAKRDGEYVLEHFPVTQDAYWLVWECRAALGETKELWEEAAKYSDITQRFFHFRVYDVLARMRNRHLFSQEYNPRTPEEKRRIRKFKILGNIYMFLKLNWLYLLVFLIWKMAADTYSPVMLVLFLPVLWNTWKTAKVSRVLNN